MADFTIKAVNSCPNTGLQGSVVIVQGVAGSGGFSVAGQTPTLVVLSEDPKNPTIWTINKSNTYSADAVGVFQLYDAFGKPMLNVLADLNFSDPDNTSFSWSGSTFTVNGIGTKNEVGDPVDPIYNITVKTP
jgi:hypothetical protein